MPLLMAHMARRSARSPTLPPAQLLTPQQRHMVRLMPPHMLPSLALHLGCMAPQWHLHMERPWDMVPRWGMVPLWVGPRWDLVPQWEVTRVLPQWAMERPLNLARLSSVTESLPITRKSSGWTEMTRMLNTLVLPLDLRSFPQLAPKLAIFSA